MTESQPQKRDATYDIARGLGMVLVIYGHFLEPIFPARPDLGKPFVQAAFDQWQIIYSFHMMLFFLVSGAVNRNLATKRFADVLRSSLRLLALAWIVHIVGAVFAIATGFNPDAAKSAGAAATAIFQPILIGSFWSIGVLWFLTSLCFVQILAHFVMRRTTSLLAVAVIAILSTVSVYLPNWFLLKTWLPGLSFFMLGAILAQRQIRVPVWTCIPLFAVTIFLAHLNTGCSFTLDHACSNAGPGLFGVWMFAGIYGFLPLFYLSALAGSFAVVGLSRGLARFSASEFLSYIGRNSLNLFIVNGFVAVFLNRYIAEIRFPTPTALHYAGLCGGVVALHLVAMRLLKPGLDFIDAGAVRIAKTLAEHLWGRETPVKVSA